MLRLPDRWVWDSWLTTDDGGTRVTETWDASRYASAVFAGLRATVR